MVNVAEVFSFSGFLQDKLTLFTEPPYFGWVGLVIIIGYIFLRVSGRIQGLSFGKSKDSSSSSSETFYQVK